VSYYKIKYEKKQEGKGRVPDTPKSGSYRKRLFPSSKIFNK
jgi:hypothetical protein